MNITDYDKAMNLTNNIIMAGDLNSKKTNWGFCVINPNGNKLQKYISASACIISAPSKPTYFSSNMNRLPDILPRYFSNKINSVQYYIKTSF